MSKHIAIAIAIASLGLASPIGASGEGRGDHCFRPAFQRRLKHVKPISPGSSRSWGLSQQGRRKVAFIDWRKIYWGELGDLISSAEGAYDDAAQEGMGIGEDQEIARGLRQELKAFAKQYGLKIVWRKKPPGIEDVTAAFLEYLDNGLSRQEQGGKG